MVVGEFWVALVNQSVCPGLSSEFRILGEKKILLVLEPARTEADICECVGVCVGVIWCPCRRSMKKVSGSRVVFSTLGEKRIPTPYVLEVLGSNKFSSVCEFLELKESSRRK